MKSADLDSRRYFVILHSVFSKIPRNLADAIMAGWNGQGKDY